MNELQQKLARRKLLNGEAPQGADSKNASDSQTIATAQLQVPEPVPNMNTSPSAQTPASSQPNVNTMKRQPSVPNMTKTPSSSTSSELQAKLLRRRMANGEAVASTTSASDNSSHSPSEAHASDTPPSDNQAISQESLTNDGVVAVQPESSLEELAASVVVKEECPHPQTIAAATAVPAVAPAPAGLEQATDIIGAATVSPSTTTTSASTIGRGTSASPPPTRPAAASAPPTMLLQHETASPPTTASNSSGGTRPGTLQHAHSFSASFPAPGNNSQSPTANATSTSTSTGSSQVGSRWYPGKYLYERRLPWVSSVSGLSSASSNNNNTTTSSAGSAHSNNNPQGGARALSDHHYYYTLLSEGEHAHSNNNSSSPSPDTLGFPSYDALLRENFNLKSELRRLKSLLEERQGIIDAYEAGLRKSVFQAEGLAAEGGEGTSSSGEGLKQDSTSTSTSTSVPAPASTSNNNSITSPATLPPGPSTTSSPAANPPNPPTSTSALSPLTLPFDPLDDLPLPAPRTTSSALQRRRPAQNNNSASNNNTSTSNASNNNSANPSSSSSARGGGVVSVRGDGEGEVVRRGSGEGERDGEGEEEGTNPFSIVRSDQVRDEDDDEDVEGLWFGGTRAPGGTKNARAAAGGGRGGTRANARALDLDALLLERNSLDITSTSTSTSALNPATLLDSLLSRPEEALAHAGPSYNPSSLQPLDLIRSAGFVNPSGGEGLAGEGLGVDANPLPTFVDPSTTVQSEDPTQTSNSQARATHAVLRRVGDAPRSTSSSQGRNIAPVVSSRDTNKELTYEEFILQFSSCRDLIDLTKKFLFSVLGPEGDCQPPPKGKKVDYVFYGLEHLPQRCALFFEEMVKRLPPSILGTEHPPDPSQAQALEERAILARDHLEQYVMTRLGERALELCRMREDDMLVLKRMQLLRFLTPESLDIPPAFLQHSAVLTQAGDELRKINVYRTPSEKVLCVVRCVTLIFRALSLAQKKPLDGGTNPSHNSSSVASSNSQKEEDNNPTPAGADDFLPLLIYVVLTSHIPHLVTNCEYIQTYLNPARLMGKWGYCLINLRSAVEFVMYVDSASVNLPEGVFDQQLQEAEKKYEQHKKARLSV
eukprot:gene23235-28221_t